MPELAESQGRAMAEVVGSEMLRQVNAGGLGLAMPVLEGMWRHTFNITNPSPIVHRAR
jgi:hypothetical protein